MYKNQPYGINYVKYKLYSVLINKNLLHLAVAIYLYFFFLAFNKLRFPALPYHHCIHRTSGGITQEKYSFA